MIRPKTVLAGVVSACGCAMVAVAVAAGVSGTSREGLSVTSGLEIVVVALVVLPWFTVYANRAAGRFSAHEEAGKSWRALSYASVLLIAGQIAAYAPAAFDLGSAEPPISILGQVLPAIFRIALCWALWRIRNAYRGTGIDFRLKPQDYAATAGVVALAAFLIFRRDVLFDYWSADSEFTALARGAMTASQVLNFVLYPAVFYASLAMSRYAVQMGGGLIARAWLGVALYGLLQPLHAFVISLTWPVFGPMASVAFDNFVVLGAYSALAFGPIFQLEATEVSRS